MMPAKLRILVVLVVALASWATASSRDLAAEPEAQAAPAGAEGAGDTDPAARLSDPGFLARAKAYTRGNYLLFLADRTLSLLVLAWLAFSGASSRLWEWIRARPALLARGVLGLFAFLRAPRRALLRAGPVLERLEHTFLFVAAFVFFVTLVSLPLDYYDDFVREHAYGFSTQTAGSWWADQVKTLLVTMVVSTLFLAPLYAVIRKFPRAWWMMGAALGCVFAVVVVAVSPVFLDPLFNTFTPLADQEMRATILDMAHRNGIAADEVFEMDASTRSVHDNAYVTGLLGTERIVLYDVLLRNYTSSEVAVVMGHEMGHYVMNHVWKGLGLALVLIVLGFYLVDRSLRWAVARQAARTGFTSAGEMATLPLLLLVLSIFLFVTLPVQSAWSRSLESAADQFALRAVAEPEAAPDAFRKMAARNLADPDPPALVEWFLYSHPAMGKRIRAAEEYLETRRPPG